MAHDDRCYLPWDEDRIVFVKGDWKIYRTSAEGRWYGYTVNGLESGIEVQAAQLVAYGMAKWSPFFAEKPWTTDGIEIPPESTALIVRNFKKGKEYFLERTPGALIVACDAYYLLSQGLVIDRKGKLTKAAQKKAKIGKVDDGTPNTPWAADNIVFAPFPAGITVQKSAVNGRYTLMRGNMSLTVVAQRLLDEGLAIPLEEYTNELVKKQIAQMAHSTPVTFAKALEGVMYGIDVPLDSFPTLLQAVIFAHGLKHNTETYREILMYRLDVDALVQSMNTLQREFMEMEANYHAVASVFREGVRTLEQIIGEMTSVSAKMETNLNCLTEVKNTYADVLESAALSALQNRLTEAHGLVEELSRTFDLSKIRMQGTVDSLHSGAARIREAMIQLSAKLAHMTTLVENYRKDAGDITALYRLFCDVYDVKYKDLIIPETEADFIVKLQRSQESLDQLASVHQAYEKAVGDIAPLKEKVERQIASFQNQWHDLDRDINERHVWLHEIHTECAHLRHHLDVSHFTFLERKAKKIAFKNKGTPWPSDHITLVEDKRCVITRDTKEGYYVVDNGEAKRTVTALHLLLCGLAVKS